MPASTWIADATQASLNNAILHSLAKKIMGSQDS
jgi:hypothetical protein